MFEHFKMSKKLKQQLGKVVSIALSVAMLAGSIPADMLGGIADVKAAETTHKLDAADDTTFSTDSNLTAEDNVFNIGSSVTFTDEVKDADGNTTSKAYFGMSDGSTITITVPNQNTGSLTVDADSEPFLTLKGSDNNSVNSSDWTNLSDDSYTLIASGEVKLYSISLTLTSDGTQGGNTGSTVELNINISDSNNLAVDAVFSLIDVADESETPIPLNGDGNTTGKVTLTSGHSYKLSSSGLPTNAIATLEEADQNGILEITSETSSITVTVTQNNTSDSKISADITLNTDNAVIPNDTTYTIKLESDDGTDIITYNNTITSYDLEANTTYNVTVTTEPANFTIRATATVDSSTAETITTGTSNLNITINLTTKIELDVELNVADNEELPTGAEIKLTNEDDADEVVALTGLAAGEKVQLWIGDTYNLTSSPSTVEAKINNGTSFTVDKDAAKITVDVTVDAQSSETTTDTHIFNATNDLADYSDGDKFEATYLNSDRYFKLVLTEVPDDSSGESDAVVAGTATVKSSSGTLGLQLEKWESAYIEFTVKGTADVVISAMGTNATNKGPIALKNADGVAQTEENNKTYAEGTTTLTYKGLSEGTYRIVSPKDSEQNRGVRILEITVTDEYESVGGTTAEYLFDASKLPAQEDNTYLVVGTKYENYFTVAGDNNKVIYRTAEGGRPYIGVDLTKKAAGAISFRVTGTADVEIEASSNGDTNYSVIGIAEDTIDGTVIPNNSGKNWVKSMEKTKITYTGLTSGVYYVISPTPTAQDVQEAINDGYTDTKIDRNTRLYTIKVTETKSSEDETPRSEWPGTISKPVVKSVTVNTADPTKLDVTVEAVVEYYDGGDKITLVMKDENDNETTSFSTRESTTHTFSFNPLATGRYSFTAYLSRDNENATIDSETPYEYDFILPLVVPSVEFFYNNGKTEDGSPIARLEWSEVQEATSYIINVVNKETGEVILGDVEYTVEDLDNKTRLDINEGLEKGQTYVAKVKAKRDGFDIAAANTETAYSDTKEVTVSGELDVAWNYAIYGLHDGTPKNNNGYSTTTETGTYNSQELPLNYDDAFLRMWSMDGSGKIQPTATDGLAFYYTKIDPNEKNFKLSAVMHVNYWHYSNAQEGFGLMATDRVGTTDAEEKAEFFNNSYQALCSKIEYRWNPDKAAADYSDNTDYPKYSMKIGIGSTEKLGITAENLGEFAADSSEATSKYYKYDTKTLETYLVNDYGAGTYNIIGNYDAEPAGTLMDITDMKLTIELNNTGYYISYTPVTIAEDGSIIEDTDNTYTNKYYNRNALSMIENDSVYVGFFSARYGDVTFRNVEFTTSDYDPNGPIDTQPVNYIEPSYDFTSGSVANSNEYELLFGANWQGNLTVKDEEGNVIIGNDTTTPKGEDESDDDYIARTGRITDTYDDELEEYKMEYNMVRKLVNIDIGTNTFYWTFTPDDTDAYNPDPEYDEEGNITRALTQLEDYTTKTGTFTVTYKAYGEDGTALYVSPNGSALGTGTKANPLDIYTAVKYVKPGQTIYLMSGTYNLAKTVTIDRGVDGIATIDEDGNETYEKYIYLLPDPTLSERIVFDFSRSCEGIVLAGNYWYISGFDVTRSSLGNNGMRVSGSFNVIDSMNFYDNGNTGLSISRYKSADTWDYWPQYNLVRNCTSYLNADQGFEDADGFAAKLTIGNGNVFDGCVAAYNADDGWDLFSKPESGKIGTVIIKNSIAYRNGYVLIKDTDEDGKISAAEAGAMDRVISFDGIEYPAGNGNGFKMGGNSMADRDGVGHTLENSFAFYNRAKGIDSNSAPNINVRNSVSFNNESYNIALYGKSAVNTDFSTEGAISYRTDDEYFVWEQVGVEYQIETDNNGNPVTAKYSDVTTDDVELTGTQITDMSEVYNNSTYYWSAASKGSYTVDAEQSQSSAASKAKSPAKLSDSGVFNTNGNKVEDNWFVNVDGYEAFDNAFKADSSSVRNPNGTIKMEGFLELTENAGDNQWEIDSEESPDIEINDNETDGSISSGNAGDEATSGVRPEDSAKYAEKLIEAKGIASSIGLWFNVVDADEIYYTGKAIKPTVHVYDGTTLLTTKDYSITYKNNVNAWEKGRTDNLYDAKAPTITVKGKGNYLGKADDQTFEIHPVSLDEEKDVFNRISANDITLISNNKDQAVKPKVTFNNKTLSSSKNKDYSFQVYKVKTVDSEDGSGDVSEGEPENGSGSGSEDGSESEPEDGSESSLENASAVALANELENVPEIEYGEKITSNKVKDVASYLVELTGHGNYTGTRVIDLYVISSADKEKLASSFKTKLNFKEKQREGYADNYGKEPIPVTLTTTGKDESGKEVSGELEVRSKSGTLLIEGVDYKLSYTNNIEVGTATVTITGISPNYFGTKAVKFKIAAPRINTLLTNKANATLKFYQLNANGTYIGSNGKKYSEFTIKGQTVAYTGSAVTFSGLVIGSLPNSDNVIDILQLDKDYMLTYKNNNKAGTASVIVKGVGNYSGSVTNTFKITPLDLKNPGKDTNGNDIKVTVSVGGNTSTVSYEKGGCKPTVTLRITADGKENKMILGQDYTVTYKNSTLNSETGNTNANKQPQVIVKGKGGLKGTLDPVAYTIQKKDLSDPNITITAEDVKVSKAGTASKLSTKIVIKDTNGKALSAGSDYDKDSITYELLSGNGSIDTSGKTPTVKITTDKDVLTVKVTVKAFDSSSNANKYAKCNYKGEISTTFRVGYAKQSIASAKVTVNYDNTTYGNGKYFYYNSGNEIKLYDGGRTNDLTVKVNGETLTYNRSGDDSIDGFTIVLTPYSYVNNTKKGTAKVTIRGTGKYTGTKVITYKIGAKEFNWWKN